MFLIFVLIFCVYFLNRYKSKKHYVPSSHSGKKYNRPPELSGKWPIIGHLPLLLGDSQSMWNLAKRISRQSLSHDGVITFSMGPRIVYALTNLDDCLTVANECLQKDFFYDFFKPWLGEGILTANGSTWKHHRKILNAAFSKPMLASFMGIFNEQAKRLVEIMAIEDGRGPFQHDKYLAVNNLETICQAALGTSPNDHNSLFGDYVEALEKIMNILITRFQKPWLYHPWVYSWSKVKKEETDALNVLHKLSDTVLQNRKQQLKENRNDTFSGFQPFLDQILKAARDGNVYSDSEIKAEVDTIIFGGHDTLATTLVYILMLIGSHVDVQEKVFQEITEVLGTNKDVDEHNILSKFVYMDAVIKESLRLYPIGPVIARYANRDVKIRNFTIPAGSSCFMFIWGLHRHSIWGPDAEVFRPERWLERTLPDPNAFGAFSVGRRACIGRVYAMMSMKTTLAYVCRHFRISSDVTKLTLKMDIFLKPSSGHLISVEKRN